MKPKLIQLRDLPWLAGMLIIIGLVVAAVVWNLVSDDGEPIPVAGWVSAAAAVAAPLLLIVLFLVQRIRWMNKYRYGYRGVAYFFEPGAVIYDKTDVMIDSDVMKHCWAKYHEEDNEPMPSLFGVSCLFLLEGNWVPSWWNRRVCGLTIGDFCIVGQGGKPVAQTAHKHELSHVYLNRLYGRFVDEGESHVVFQKVGV